MSLSYTYWQDPKDGLFVGYWNDYPDFPTQGHDLPELQLMLRDIRALINDGTLVDEPRNVGGYLIAARNRFEREYMGVDYAD